MASSASNELFGVHWPIIQAPMAGQAARPELVAAVSNAGGLGSLGAGYMSPQQIGEAIARVRQLTQRPFNVNLFCVERTLGKLPDARDRFANLLRRHVARAK